MNILLVDDDQYIIDEIKTKVDWTKTGIMNIFTANSSHQAKKILEQKDIDLMICDIEMPYENGLLLLQWEREYSNKVESAILTSYAEFEYARKAITLGSVEYLLKPIDFVIFNRVLLQLIQRVKEKQKTEIYKQQYLKLKNTLKRRKELFWENLILAKINSIDEIEDAIAYYNLPYRLSEEHLYIIIDIYDYKTISEKLEHKMFAFIMENIADEILAGKQLSSECVIWSNTENAARGNLIVKKDHPISKAEITEICNKYISVYEQYISSSIGCYIGIFSELNIMPQTIGQVIRMYEDNVTTRKKIFFLEDYKFIKMEYIEPEFYLWESMLKKNEMEVLYKKVAQYFKELDNGRKLNRKVMEKFRRDFTQMIYNVLFLKKLSSYQFFVLADEKKLYDESLKSVNCMLEYVWFNMEKISEYMEKNKSIDEIIGQLKQYIEENLSEDLTRNKLSDAFNFNPDYLASAFSTKEGISLRTYIIQRRILRAKELLKDTELQISSIATEVGFQSFSYFTKKFKEHSGMTPNEFRKKNKCYDLL